MLYAAMYIVYIILCIVCNIVCNLNAGRGDQDREVWLYTHTTHHTPHTPHALTHTRTPQDRARSCEGAQKKKLPNLSLDWPTSDQSQPPTTTLEPEVAGSRRQKNSYPNSRTTPQALPYSLNSDTHNRGQLVLLFIRTHTPDYY